MALLVETGKLASQGDDAVFSKKDSVKSLFSFHPWIKQAMGQMNLLHRLVSRFGLFPPDDGCSLEKNFSPTSGFDL